MNTKDNAYNKLAVFGVQDSDEMPPDYLRRNVMAAIGRVAGQRCVENRPFIDKAGGGALGTDEVWPVAKAVG